MREFVGVESWFRVFGLPGAIKREALIFHRIAVPFLSHFLRVFEHTGTIQEEFLDEINWLIEAGILYEPKSQLAHESLTANEEYQSYAKIESRLISQLEEFKEQGRLYNLFRLVNHADKGLPVPEDFGTELNDILFHILTTTEARSRLIALQLRELEQLDAFPVLHPEINLLPEPEADETEVVQIVINALPVPDDSTPWEQIRNYRREPESISKFLALRNWMGDVSRGAYTRNEAEVKLELLLNDYQEHMEQFKLITRFNTIKAIFKVEAGLFTGGWLTGVGAIPGMIGMIATPLFYIMQRQVALLQEERKAPGREVAYIVKAREEFEMH